jgi:hypothetical protein
LAHDEEIGRQKPMEATLCLFSVDLKCATPLRPQAKPLFARLLVSVSANVPRPSNVQIPCPSSKLGHREKQTVFAVFHHFRDLIDKI